MTEELNNLIARSSMLAYEQGVKDERLRVLKLIDRHAEDNGNDYRPREIVYTNVLRECINDPDI